MVAGAAVASDIQRLRAQIERVQGRKLDAPVLPTHPALADLLPGGGLVAGSSYQVGPSMRLLFSLLAPASHAGSWCGVVGMPEFGAEAAEHSGVDLGHIVLVPRPEARWLTVASTLADAFPVVAVRPSGGVGGREVSRLAARLRERGVVLLVQGQWPQAEAAIEVTQARWSGLGEGHGYLDRVELTVTVTSRRFGVPRTGRLPDVRDVSGLSGIDDVSRSASPRLRAVG